MTPQEIVRLLSLLTLISNILVVVLLLFVVVQKLGFLSKDWQKFLKFVKPRTVVIAFFVALTSMMGSLYFSEVALYEPCKLCWFQRIFMYPLVFLFATALAKKLKETWKFASPLIVLGLITSLYHYYLQINPQALTTCGTVGFSASCSERFTTTFGYITIPWMSFSAFAVVFILMLVYKTKSK